MALNGPETPRPTLRYPKEPYPALSVIAIAVLALSMLWFVALYGMGIAFAEPSVSTTFIAMTVVSLTLPFVGVRALFGDHPYALVALTVIGAVHLIVGFSFYSMPDARIGPMAFGPGLLGLAVAVFGWWKLMSTRRRVDSPTTDQGR